MVAALDKLLGHRQGARPDGGLVAQAKGSNKGDA
jgi:hypothetical protein